MSSAQSNISIATTHNNAPSKPIMKSTNSAKTTDAARKQSPVDSASRRAPAPKAWTGGPNPLIQRAPSASQSNGVATPPKVDTNSQKEPALTDKHAHDRLTFILGASIGLTVVITTRAGNKFEGLFAGSSSAAGTTKLLLHMTKELPQISSATSNGIASREAALVGSSPDHAMTFDTADIVDMSVSDLTIPDAGRMANGSAAKFQTDVDISGNQNRAERTLQRWVPDESERNNLSLESDSSAPWDQFATNQQLFGTHSTYDENHYTTALDRSSESYKQREARAARIAREIEGTQSTNVHQKEERGHVMENEPDDEESKYSGVRRDDRAFPPLAVGGSNKYTPPARRAPTAQATVVGAPVDPAIISAQLSKDNASHTQLQQKSPVAVQTAESATVPPENSDATLADKATEEIPTAQASESLHKSSPSGDQTEGVANRVLQQFRQFADSEKQKLAEKRRAQASQDKAAKLNDLLRFSKTFKLKTPVPKDLVGILAKDPTKQEAIIEQGNRDHEESTSKTTSPAATLSTEVASRKIELSQMPEIPDRQPQGRGRGGYLNSNGRADRGSHQQPFGRGTTIPLRPAGQQDRKPHAPHQVPSPIPIIDGRLPPTGPFADQAGLGSPQRSNMHTPTSATSQARFNLNVKASEFRPTAASFNPATSSNTPSSPASTQRAASVSRTASPSLFFGARKPKPAADRPSVTAAFNSIQKLKDELKSEKTAKTNDGGSSSKDYSANGGIPNAFQTGPRWIVRAENEDKTYLTAFERPAVQVVSPGQSRSASTNHAYHQQLHNMPPGPAHIPPMNSPQHIQPGGPNFGHQYDDAQSRMPMVQNQMYSSPGMSSRQPSNYASPMPNHAQLAYTQQPYYGAGAQMPVQIRQYPGTPGVMHGTPMAAPIMMHQPSQGQYMNTPQQFNGQMPMYSPSHGHAYPQTNGYGSPSRAPPMMHQGSQQGHHPGQQMMYSMSQGVPMGYAQNQMSMPRGGYSGQQYGSSPQQPYPMGQRTMSSGYGQIPHKVMPQHMHQANQGPPMNAPQQPAAFSQMEIGQDEGK